MAVNGARKPRPAGVALAQLGRVAADGSAADPYLRHLVEGHAPSLGLDLADAVHLLCSVHGHFPGLVALAGERAADPVLRSWLESAGEGFEGERSFLLRLTAAVGPIPSTPGAAETEAGLSAARHALETLGNSERSGCALGAACALVADWRPIRLMLDRAAKRAGIEGQVKMSLPDRDSVAAVIDHVAEVPAAARALAFGSEQLLLQHRALFALLEARSESRGDC